MLTPQKIREMKRIKEEYQELKSKSNIGVTIGLVYENTIFEWSISLIGQKIHHILEVYSYLI